MAEDRENTLVPVRWTAAEVVNTFVDEERADRRILGIACVLSLLLHAPLLWVPSPFQSYDGLASTDSPSPQLFRLQHFLFRSPPPSAQHSKKMPIPDPTPDGPEPIYLAAPETVAVDDFVFGLPDVDALAATTGGNAEPNAEPYGDMFFRSAGTNPFVDTEDDPLSTFGLDVDTGSYTVARRYLETGHLPPPAAVRVEEFLNYFDYREPPPAEGDFAVYAEGAPAPFGENQSYHLLRFHLRGRTVEAADRLPADLTFVVDVSGSMAAGNRLGLVKKALYLLLDELRPDDRVALVVYGTEGRVLLAPTGDHEAIRAAIGWLAPDGSTNADQGLYLAYRLADRHRRPGAVQRLILCSDGVANVGRTSAAAILERIRGHAEQGIELTTVGFGMGNYNDVLMERLADTGDGRYAYVDDLDEARRIFVENLSGTLQTIAGEARVQVDWNPEVVSRYRLLGYENRAVADQRFRDDTVDAGEIGAGHAVTALYEIKLHRPLVRADRVATLRLRYASTAAGEMVETAHPVGAADFAPVWESASGALRLSSLVAELAEVLKESYWARDGDLDEVFHRLQQVSPEFAGDREVAELVSLAGKAADLRRRAS